MPRESFEVKLKRVVWDKKKYPTHEFDGKVYFFLDEFRNEDTADNLAETARKRGFCARVNERLIDDIMKGRWWYVYDVYIRKCGKKEAD